jgi:hypothetical protein
MVLAAKVDGCQVVAEREGPRRGPLGCSAPEEYAAFFTQHRGVFVLWALGGLPPAQVAAVLGKAPGTVRAQLHRARARLRLVLGERPSPGGP